MKSKIAEKSTANFRRQQRLTLKLIGLAVTSLGAVTLGLSLVFSGIPAMVSVAAFCLIVLGLLLMTSPDAVTFVLDMLLNWLL